MKVKVNVKHVPLNQVEYFLNEALSEALADLDAAHREIERLFQENKDLRLAESRALSDKKKAESDLAALKEKFSDTCSERDELLGQIELRPKVANLWSLLQENGLIVNTEEGPHNNG